MCWFLIIPVSTFVTYISNVFVHHVTNLSTEAGGTHLPDITVVTPVFDEEGKEIIFYTASRGHHRDIGGLGGISGNPNATYLEQEGALFKSFLLASGGRFDEEGMSASLIVRPSEVFLIFVTRYHENLSPRPSSVP
jgi:Hydantoinase B/oxoprolinase